MYAVYWQYMLVQWTDKPVTTICCNTTEQRNRKLTFHMYATMVVRVPAKDHSIRIIITLDFLQTHLTSFMSSKYGSMSQNSVPVVAPNEGNSQFSIANFGHSPVELTCTS